MKWLWIGGVILCLLVGNRVVYSSELHEFGHIGTVRIFQGQVRDPADEPLAGAMLELTNQETQKEYSIQCKKDGRFTKKRLPSGTYEVKVMADGFDPCQFTVTIDPLDPTASEQFIITRIPPGCSGGGAGVALVNDLSDPSYQSDQEYESSN